MNRDYEVAIFDMDGTLLDSMRYWRYTSLEFLLAHQMPVCPEDLARMHDTSSRKLESFAAAIMLGLRKKFNNSTRNIAKWIA